MKEPFVRKEQGGRSGWLGDGRIAIGLTLGFFTALILGVALEIDVGSGNTVEVLIAFAAVVVAVASALVSLVALSEQRRMRQAGTDPVLICHLAQRRDEPQMIMIAVSNVGAGAAMNIEILPGRPEELGKRDDLVMRFFEIKHPIKVILQGSSVQYSFGTGPMLLGDNPIPPFEVELRYQDIEGGKYGSTHIIDTRELHMRDASAMPDAKIWRELEKMNRMIQRFGTEPSPVHSVIETPTERTRRRTEETQRISQQLRGIQDSRDKKEE